MTAPSLLDELEEVVRLAEKATPGPWLYRSKSNSWHKPPQQGTVYSYGEHIVGMDSDDEADNGWDEAFLIAAVQFMTTHHAELADMANELRVARESFNRCDEICKCTAEGWRTAEEDIAKRLEAAERDARATKRSAETLCRIYFEIAAEAVGEDKVRAERDRRIHATQEGEE